MTPHISIIGLGYVGLPLAVEFGKHFPVVGFDINARRLDELRAGQDRTLEVDADGLKAATHLSFSNNIEDLKASDFFIVTVPTPMGIDTQEVLEAAGTKWNFLPFRPGLVGGHCIGVDPYYLTHKAEALGYHPEIILAVAHDQFRELDMTRFSKDNVVVFDIKAFLAKELIDGRL